ncbi:dTMP kinase [Sorangium sp. So ce233]|uniref:dTMP kinase n=1 Tax=Sorangium sp. So ce233 TaxID=3133290 RepID=UPI003F613611
MTSMFIIIEGPDGTGKSTQARRLVTALAASGRNVALEVEPTDGPIGRRIRELTRAGSDADPREIALLFAADRMAHSRQIRALLDAGVVVVCDRYHLSTSVYQGSASGDPSVERWADQLSAYACRPDLTIVLDAPLDVCAERLRARGRTADMFEQAETQRRVHAAYARAEDFLWGDTVVRVDASGPADEVAARVMAAVEKKLSRLELPHAAARSAG